MGLMVGVKRITVYTLDRYYLFDTNNVYIIMFYRKITVWLLLMLLKIESILSFYKDLNVQLIIEVANLAPTGRSKAHWI